MSSLEIQAVHAAFEDNEVDLDIVLNELNGTELKWFAGKLDVLVSAVDRKLNATRATDPPSPLAQDDQSALIALVIDALPPTDAEVAADPGSRCPDCAYVRDNRVHMHRDRPMAGCMEHYDTNGQPRTAAEASMLLRVRDGSGDTHTEWAPGTGEYRDDENTDCEGCKNCLKTRYDLYGPIEDLPSIPAPAPAEAVR